MKYLVSIIREIEVDAANEFDARWKAIELDGRPGEVHTVMVERLEQRTEAEVVG